MTPQQNSTWQGKVARLLGQGFGAEDIALKLSCDPDAVRREIKIYRQEGRLAEIVRPKVKG
jgi:DNA-binding NarL/FixJ family response regulator